MKYPTTIGAVVKLWHPSASGQKVERAIGRTASHSHQVGQRRTQGDKAPYHDTYCSFDVVSVRLIDSVDLLSKCLVLLNRRKSAITKLLATGGKAIVAVKIVDRSFAQLYIEHAQLAALATLGVGLVFE
jgi:hypothetical protein